MNNIICTCSPPSLEGGEVGLYREGLGREKGGTWHQQESFLIYALSWEFNLIPSAVDTEGYSRPEQLSEEVEQSWVIPL